MERRIEPLQTMDADTLLSAPLKRNYFVVDGLIPQGVSLLCGNGKIGKSWACLWLGLQVAQGKPFWGCSTTQCDVLYLSLEDPYRRIQDRLYRITDQASDNLRFAIICGQIRKGLEIQIEDHLKAYPKTGLIIIDTLQKIRSASDASGRTGMYGSDYEDISALKKIADAHAIAMVLVHHLRKMVDSSDPFNQVSGSTGLTGAVDSTLIMNKDSRESDQAKILVTGRDLEYQELIIHFKDFIWHLESRKFSSEIEQENTPDFIFQLVDFMKKRKKWSGNATELLRELDNSEVSSVSVGKLIGHFYYDYLEPAGIKYTTKRTSSSRQIILEKSDDSDENDADDDCCNDENQKILCDEFS